jgi:hypothetical protein
MNMCCCEACFRSHTCRKQAGMLTRCRKLQRPTRPATSGVPRSSTGW